MAGAVIENLSTKKMILLIACLVIIEVIIILIGAIKAPHPTHSLGPHVMTTCKADNEYPNKLHVPSKCHEVNIETSKDSSLSPDQVIFVMMIPSQNNLSLIRWFQYLLCYANFRIQFHLENQVGEDAFVTMDLHIAYSDASDDEKPWLNRMLWNKVANSTEDRKLDCNFRYNKTIHYEKYEYDCDALFLFELGSLPHRRYLLNMRLPIGIHKGVEKNRNIGKLINVETIAIMQNGGFTTLWLAMKSFFFILMIFPVAWFWRRVTSASRNPSLIEKSCFAVGLGIVFLNLPLEFFTIYFDVPWMLFFTDVRQGAFYAFLFCFWLIFIGEHLMDQVHKNKLSSYKWQLSCIILLSLALLAFDLAERGAQVHNPFGTIWKHPWFGYSLLILAAVSGSLYMIMLFYLVFKVFRSIRFKQRFILQKERALHLTLVVNRFKRLMILSLVTASITIVFFFLEQKIDGAFQEWFSIKVEITSAFFAGTYSLWNIYVFLVLSMYAPSHKALTTDTGHVTPGENSEVHELAPLRHDSEVTQVLQMTQQKEREE